MGKEIAKVLASQGMDFTTMKAHSLSRTGAHVTIFARGQKGLDEAREEILATRRQDTQSVTTVAVDMSVASNVRFGPSFHVIIG